MRRCFLVAMGLCSLLACGGLSLPPPLSTGAHRLSAEAYPDSGAVVLTDEATLAYRVLRPPDGGPEQVVATLDHYRRLQILRPDGLSQATLELPLDGFTTVTEVIGRSVDGNGVETALKPSNIRTRRQHTAGVSSPEIRLMEATLPAASVGGTVEFRYQRVFLDPWNVPLWTYGGPLPTVQAVFGLVAEEGIEVDLLHGRGDQATERSPTDEDTFHGQRRLRFVERELPPYFAEPDGTHLAHRSPWTLPALRTARVAGRVERMTGWAGVAKHVLAQMAASEPGHGRGALLDRLGYLRRTLVPQAGLGLGVRRPQSSSALRLGTPACSRDAAAFARGLLSDSSADVQVVLATGPAAPPFSEGFASPAAFSRALLRVRAQPGMKEGLSCSGEPATQDFLCGARVNDWLLVDPACASCGAGLAGRGLAGSRALAIDEAGVPRWVDLEFGGPERHAKRVEVQYRVDVDGSLQGTLLAVAHGFAASHWRAGVEAALHGAGSKESLVEPVHYAALFGDGDGPSASSLTVRGVGEPDRAIAAEAALSARLTPLANGRAGLVPADLFGTSLPGRWRANRQDALVTDGPKWQDVRGSIQVPLHTQIDVPVPVKVANHAFEYAAGFAFEGRQLRYARRFVLKTATIPAADWPKIYDAVETIRAAEARPLAIQFPAN